VCRENNNYYDYRFRHTTAILQKRAVETNGRTELSTGCSKKYEATVKRNSSEIEQSQGIGRVSKKKGAE
jgi:hypothetical protein